MQNLSTKHRRFSSRHRWVVNIPTFQLTVLQLWPQNPLETHNHHPAEPSDCCCVSNPCAPAMQASPQQHPTVIQRQHPAEPSQCCLLNTLAPPPRPRPPHCRHRPTYPSTASASGRRARPATTVRGSCAAAAARTYMTLLATLLSPSRRLGCRCHMQRVTFCRCCHNLPHVELHDAASQAAVPALSGFFRRFVAMTSPCPFDQCLCTVIVHILQLPPRCCAIAQRFFLTLSLWSPRLPAIVIVYMLQVPPRCCTTNGYCPHSALSTSLRPCRQLTLRLLSCTRCRRRHAAASSLNSCCPHSATLSVLCPCDRHTCLLSLLTYCRRRHAAVPELGDRGGSCQAGGHRQHDGTVRAGGDLRSPHFISSCVIGSCTRAPWRAWRTRHASRRWVSCCPPALVLFHAPCRNLLI